MMKKIKLITIVLFLLVSFSMQAKEKFTSTFKKEYEVNRNATVKINNTFGDVQCYNWDKNEVSIEVLVEVIAADKKAADRVFDRISVEISGDENLVQERTRVNNIKGRNTKFSIIVNVYLPESVNIDFTNRFGNIFVGTVKGKAELSQSFGTLQIEELQNESNDVFVEHGSLSADNINEAVIDIKHSEMSVDNARSLNLDAGFTSVVIDKIDVLNVNSNFGSLEIDKIGTLQGDFNGTSVEIDYLMKSIESTFKMGDVSIDRISRNFSEIDIDGKHASISLELESESSFSFELETKFASVYLPSEFKITKEKLGFNSYRYHGRFGNASGQSLIKIESEFGTVEIN
jgi:hypothetical protein